MHPRLAALIARRIERGVTRAEVAAATGISSAGLSQLERGRHEPRFLAGLEYAHTLGFRLLDLEALHALLVETSGEMLADHVIAVIEDSYWSAS